LPSKSNSHSLRPAKDEAAFSEVAQLIAASRERALRDVDTALINLYWKVGEIISRKIEAAEWGDAVVDRLAPVHRTNGTWSARIHSPKLI